MTAKTRYFLVGSVLVLVAGLSIGLVAYYGGIPPNPFASRSGLAELRYVPGDAGVVAFANVRHVMDSDLRQRLRQLEGATEEGRKELQDHTGIDVERDIDRVVAWIGGKAGAHGRSGLVLASGRFDSSRLEGLALEHGGRVVDYQGKRMMVLSKEGRGEEFAMAFLEPGVVAIGNEETIRLAIDRGKRGDNALANTELMKRVEGLSGASLWAVGSFDAVSAQTALPSELRDRMPPIAWFSASGRVNGGLEATVKAEARDEQGAENLRDLVRGFVALARMQADSRPAAKTAMPTFQLTGEGREVALTFSVTTGMLDAIEALHGRGRSTTTPDETGAK